MFFGLFGKTNSLSPAEAKERLDQDKSIQLIDVREKGEYKTGFIKGAKNMPLSTLEANLGKLKKDQTIFVYCQSGMRSKNAYKILEANGFTEVYNIGGIMSWPYGVVQK